MFVHLDMDSLRTETIARCWTNSYTLVGACVMAGDRDRLLSRSWDFAATAVLAPGRLVVVHPPGRLAPHTAFEYV